MKITRYNSDLAPFTFGALVDRFFSDDFFGGQSDWAKPPKRSNEDSTYAAGKVSFPEFVN